MKMARVTLMLITICMLQLNLWGQTSATPAKKPHGIIAKGLADIDSASYGIGYNAVTGVANAATDAHLSQKLVATSDSLVKHLSISAAGGLAILRDTLLDSASLHKYSNLRDSVLGDGLRNNIRHAVDAAVGDSSAHELKRLIRGSLDETFSKKTGNDLKNIIDTVGEASNGRLKSLLDTLLAHVSASLITTTNKIKDDIHTTTGDVNTSVQDLKHALWVAIAALLVFFGGCVYLMYLKRKYSDVTTVLTHQIENMPDGISKQDFKQRIQNQAQSAEVEGFLHQILVNKKMAGDDKTDTSAKNK